MPIRRDQRRRATPQTRSGRSGRSFWFSLFVLTCLVAFFALMRLASRPFLLDGSQTVAEAPRPNLFASLNPWRVDDDSTGTYVAGDGTRVDPLAPKSGDELFAVADSVFLRSETTQVVPGNEGETTKPGAEFADFDLLADESDHATDFKWDPPEKSDWDELTDASYAQNDRGLEFLPIDAVDDGFLGKTLAIDGKPTYVPNVSLDQRQFDNTAETVETKSPEMALKSDESKEPSGMKPVEEIQPGVVFIPSGYRRAGNIQTSEGGSMGRVSPIPF